MPAPRPESIADQVVAKKKKRLTADEPRVPTGGGINTNYGPQQPDGRIWQEKVRDAGNSAVNYALGPHAQALGWFSLGDETNLGSQLATVGELMDQRINVTSQAMKNDPEDVARALFRRQIPLMGVAGAGGAMGLGAMSNSDQRQEPRKDVY